MPAVRASFVASDRTYGARRIWRDVLEAGFSCGLHKIERLMRAQALRARPRRRALPRDDGERSASAIAPNVLDRQFTAGQPNRKWIADFTYIWTAEGWLYVAAVIDLFSRRVVGWSMKAEMNAQLVTDALLMAVWRRGRPDALLHHSDRGSPIHQRAVPTSDGRQWRRLFNEPLRKRVGQRGHGKLLLLDENRTDRAKCLPHSGRRQGRRVRLHREIRQHNPQALDHRLPQSG
jgi:putative transposase